MKSLVIGIKSQACFSLLVPILSHEVLMNDLLAAWDLICPFACAAPPPRICSSFPWPNVLSIQDGLASVRSVLVASSPDERQGLPFYHSYLLPPQLVFLGIRT